MLGPLPSLAPLAGRGGIETAPPSLEKVLLERKKVQYRFTWAGRWLGTWISMRKILWVKVRALDVGLDSASPRQPAPLPRETQADRRRCPPARMKIVKSAKEL